MTTSEAPMATCEAGYNLGQQLAEVLGLANRPIRRIVLDVCVDDVVRVYVEELVNKEQSQDVVRVLRSFDLKPTGEKDNPQYPALVTE